MRRGNVALTLSHAQGRIFELLLVAYRKNVGPVSGPEISERASVASPGNQVMLLRDRLHGARIKVVSVYGKRGGYQLDVLP